MLDSMFPQQPDSSSCFLEFFFPDKDFYHLGDESGNDDFRLYFLIALSFSDDSTKSQTKPPDSSSKASNPKLLL